MLELAILGLLKQQDLHGYELKKRLVDTLGVGSAVSFGSLYPALGRLDRAGAVEAVAPSAARVPMTGSIGGELAAFRTRPGAGRGRTRKVYRITPRGEELFAELLSADQESSRDDRLFNLRLAFARYLPAEARLGLLELRRAHLADRLARLGARLRTGKSPLDSYGRSLIDHDRQVTEHDISWLDTMIATEHASAGDPASTEHASAGDLADAEHASAGDPASTEHASGSGAASGSRLGRLDRPTLSGLRRPAPANPALSPTSPNRHRPGRPTGPIQEESHL